MDYSKKRRQKQRALDTPFPNFESPEGVNQPALKNLHSILVKLSSKEGIKVTTGDICKLSKVVFPKLEERFEKLFSELSAAEDLGESSSSLGLFDDVEVLDLLLRCCILLLPLLLAAQQNHIFEIGLILLKILKKSVLPNLKKKTGKKSFVFEDSVFRECVPQDNGCSTSSVEGFSASIEFLEPCNPLLFLKCTMLEVFVDEMLASRQVMGYFKMINHIADTNEKLFNSHTAQDDAGILMEILCNHFIQSFSDKQAFREFFSRLFCMHDSKLEYSFRPPVLSINAAVSLFLNPIMASAPKYIQVHLISIVSEAVNIEDLKPDRELTNCFLSTFEKSVILYKKHMSHLQTDDGLFANSSPQDFVYPPFESYISPETKGKVDNLVSRLDRLSNEVSDCSISRRKSDLVGTSLRFVKDCLNAYTVSCQEEILTVLSSLLLRVSEIDNNKSIRPIKGTAMQHLYLLMSLLKLMSISLLQAIRCVRHSADLSYPRSLKDISSCKEYDFVLAMVACFKDLDTSLPLQQDLNSLMSSHSTRHVDSKMMFLHFSGLMSLGFVTGLDCLVKACLLTNIALLNLFVFEEGNLDALQALVDAGGQYYSSELPIVQFKEMVSDQSSSLVVASRFHKIRSLYSSVVGNKHNENESSYSPASHMEAAACVEEETEETCSGEIFLKCMIRENVSDLDDLADFIECKQGKDYMYWIKNRERFRKWRSKKVASLEWKERINLGKSIEGRKILRLSYHKTSTYLRRRPRQTHLGIRSRGKI